MSESDSYRHRSKAKIKANFKVQLFDFKSLSYFTRHTALAVLCRCFERTTGNEKERGEGEKKRNKNVSGKSKRFISMWEEALSYSVSNCAVKKSMDFRTDKGYPAFVLTVNKTPGHFRRAHIDRRV
ncbi:hypothetical protein NPIL_328351 [Nephila pilipes]|uniref:Uncharacterized protein n=1 Tax=Nephila pilipes TaxID=299642 RepID=A0A8X6NUB3_NEPPI|nr:hypothetical protein NPIL_328351 [Nephila pilipes]